MKRQCTMHTACNVQLEAVDLVLKPMHHDVALCGLGADRQGALPGWHVAAVVRPIHTRQRVAVRPGVDADLRVPVGQRVAQRGAELDAGAVHLCPTLEWERTNLKP